MSCVKALSPSPSSLILTLPNPDSVAGFHCFSVGEKEAVDAEHFPCQRNVSLLMTLTRCFLFGCLFLFLVERKIRVVTQPVRRLTNKAARARAYLLDVFMPQTSVRWLEWDGKFQRRKKANSHGNERGKSGARAFDRSRMCAALCFITSNLLQEKARDMKYPKSIS